MQKPQVTYFFALQTTYECLEIGLFANENCIEYCQEDKLNINKVLIDRLTMLLTKRSLSLADISFFAANNGPGPFSSLRVLLTTLNGIAFACKTPLIGIDGLRSLVEENSNPAWPTTVALLNAYNNDCYYALEVKGKDLEIGCIPIRQLSDVLPCNQPIRAIGQGVEIFAAELSKLNTIKIDKPVPDFVSLNFIADKGILAYKTEKNWSNQLLPAYLKQVNYKPAFGSSISD